MEIASNFKTAYESIFENSSDKNKREERNRQEINAARNKKDIDVELFNLISGGADFTKEQVMKEINPGMSTLTIIFLGGLFVMLILTGIRVKNLLNKTHAY